MADAGARFADTVTIVTGSSRGIGLAIAARLVAEGGRVVLTGRRREPLEAAAAELGPAATAVAGAADDPVHRAGVFAHVARTHGRLDHLVNNTGINPVYGPLASVDVAAARKILEVNVVAALEWSRDAAAAGLTRSIVNIASVAGGGASPGIGMYGVSKAALSTSRRSSRSSSRRASGSTPSPPPSSRPPSPARSTRATRPRCRPRIRSRVSASPTTSRVRSPSSCPPTPRG